MKKITDERLVLRNLQNIRILFFVQTMGILCILGYDLIHGGFEHMRDNPLWMLFIITSVVSAYLSMSINVQQEHTKKNPKKSLLTSLLVLVVIVLGTSYLTSISPESSTRDGLLLGIILFICGLIPILYVYKLRMKQLADLVEE
ncbi:hypothetical protein ABEY61_21325 [Bacillus toyonensis]|uniref:hypothetical protein n=1 Tax=Bacillus toyonensis TaxID=155322 RepID=UPI002E1E083B|nr:hypothetical protein [Bacillus toyonensis]HDR7892371.1 hypothetical protein [Bacillus toyonensis]